MEEALRIAQSTGDRALINRARIGLLQMLVAVGDLDRVEPMAREALDEAQRQHDLRSEHFAHHFLAECPLIAGDAAAAAPRYRRALELAHALGERTEIVKCLSHDLQVPARAEIVLEGFIHPGETALEALTDFVSNLGQMVWGAYAQAVSAKGKSGN